MGRITLREAIEWYDKELSARQFVDEQLRDMACLILAAAKAFACERCGGTGWVFGEPERGHRKMLDCPACAEYRRIAKEGVEE